MNDFLHNIKTQAWDIWAIKVFVIIFLTAILNVTLMHFFNYLQKKLINTKAAWDDILLESARIPVKVLLWILALALIMRLTAEQTGINLYDPANLIKNLGIVSCLFWVAFNFMRGYENHLAATRSGSNLDMTTVVAITKLIRIIILVAAALMTLQTFGVSIAGIIAFGGIGGIAIGFAAKDLLANFFGALMIFLDRPFSVGDWIRSPDRQIEGIVEYIGWRLVHIRTFDKKMLYVPNSIFSTIIIENPSRMPSRRILETISIRYEDLDKVTKIIDETREMLNQNINLDPAQGITVSLEKFDKDSVNFFVQAFTPTNDYNKYLIAKQEVLLKINEIIGKNKAQLAFTAAVNMIEAKVSLINDLDIPNPKSIDPF
jgi:MscS family membrane protein